MAKLYLDHEPISGIAHWIDTDEGTGISTFGADQDVTAILEANQIAYNADHGNWDEGERLGIHVGSIPMNLYDQWEREGIIGDQEAMARKLNDIDFRKLRTRPGTI